MKALLKKVIPKPAFALYHRALAVLANAYYRNPSESMVVIGVTGTSGKSTAIEFIESILISAGFRAGSASTIKFRIGDDTQLNDKKMTMVGRFQLQKLLSQMRRASCDYAIIETTSEGIKQFRHMGVHYDIVVVTNLYPEHIDSHGSFENYKNAKLELCRHLGRQKKKIINGKEIKKAIIVNLDNSHAPSFLDFNVDIKYGVTVSEEKTASEEVETIRGIAFNEDSRFGFRVDGREIRVNIPGVHNISNALLSLALGVSQRIEFDILQKGIESVRNVPGRIEFINAGQPFYVVVDYAFEPVAMEKLYDVAKDLDHHRIIHVLGTTGGGRDKSRGRILGKMAGENADIVIATNEDPYDDNPHELAMRIVVGAESAGKEMNKNVFLEMDREKAIRAAIETAEEGDIVLVTGKGCEQAIVGARGEKIPWDDRKKVREAIASL